MPCAPPDHVYTRAGTQATELMWELKDLFDPDYVLNPGVILNRDPLVHVKNLKPSPAAHPLVNRCIECGFCESNCPSRCACEPCGCVRAGVCVYSRGDMLAGVTRCRA